MPGFDGLDLLRHVKEQAPESDVVIMTGNAREHQYTAQALKGGAFWYLEKPFRFENIVYIIERILERREQILAGILVVALRQVDPPDGVVDLHVQHAG